MEYYRSKNIFNDNDVWNEEEMAKYLLHDPEDKDRIKKFTDALKYAQSKGIELYIITTNNIPLNEHHQYFIDIFSNFGVDIKRENIFGGQARGSKSTRYSRTKEEVILQEIIGEKKDEE